MANTTWQDIATRKVAERTSRIPVAWRLPSTIGLSNRTNLLSIPRESGLLTADELRLTENYDATALLAGLTSGLLSSVAVTTAFCKRSAIAQQCCNCLTEIFYDDALRRAAELDAFFLRTGQPIGPLHGLPISIKDTFLVKGYDATIGFADLCFAPAESNSALVELLLALGAVLYCKTNIPQAVSALDSNNNIFGRTLNPRNTKLTAGGSSGGEGALIAMRGSILGVGTDVGGSIRIPAACNQLYGVKPSHGRTPYAGQASPGLPGSHKLALDATAGPLATTLRDCELLLSIISDTDASAYDPDVIPQPWLSQPSLRCLQLSTPVRPLRVGVIYADGHVQPLPPISRLMKGVVRTLKSSSSPRPAIEVIELDISAFGGALLKSLNGLMSIDGANAYLDHLAKTGEPLSPWHATRIRRRPQKSLDEVRVLQAQRIELMTQFGRVWREKGGFWAKGTASGSGEERTLDVIICPNAPHPIAPIDRWNTTNYTSMFNVLDYPCGVLPLRFYEERDGHGELAPGKPLNGWDRTNQELWTKVDRKVYVDSPLNLQVVTPRLMERQLIEAMAILDEALAPLKDGAEKASKL